MPAKVHEALTPVKSAQLALDSLKEQRTDILGQLDAIQTELDAISGVDIDEVQSQVAGVNDRAAACRIVASNLDVQIAKVEAELTEASKVEGRQEYEAAQGEIRLAVLSAIDALAEATTALQAAQAANGDAARARKKMLPDSNTPVFVMSGTFRDKAIREESNRLAQWLNAN